VATGRDPCRPVHIHPYVALLTHVRRARVDADPHLDRAPGQPGDRRFGRRQRPGRRRERDEERIPLRVHLHPAVGCERLPQNTSVLGQCVRVPLRT
jgi:hypothetical protein